MRERFQRGTPAVNLADAPPAAADDRQVVALLRERPAEGIARLYDQYGRLVFSMALRVVRDHGVAEEITQDVFERCWRNIDRYNAERGSLSAWLLTIAHHRAVDVLRSRQGKEMRQAVSDQRLALLATSDPALDEALLRDEVQQALGTLPAAQREVIELIYWTGLTRREVADQLDVPLGTVHTRMRLGVDKLRAVLAHVLTQE